MAVTQEARHDVYNHFQETMGDERAATLMEMLPPVGWGDVATKQDLMATKQDLGHEIAALRQWTELRFDKVDQRFDMVNQRFDMVDQRFDLVDQRFDQTEKTMATTLATKADVEAVRVTIYRVLLTQTLVILGVMVGLLQLLG